MADGAAVSLSARALAPRTHCRPAVAAGGFHGREAQARGSSSGRTFAGATRLADAPLEHLERTRWDPKDSELCLTRAKPGETPVEARSDSDVQIDRRS